MMGSPTTSPDDLGVLDPVSRHVDLANGAMLEVLPLTVRQLPAFVRALGPAREAMADPDVDIWDLIADHGESIAEALPVAIQMPRDVVECMPPGDYLTCLNAVLEANRDFFFSWILRPTVKMWEKSAEPSPDGPMYCPSSLPQGMTQVE